MSSSDLTDRGMSRAYRALLVGFAALVLCTACGSSSKSGPRAPEVEVADVIQQDVKLYSEWVATLDGFVNAQIQPQVTGYLIKQDYREGSFVHKGDVLFEIDPVPFRLTVDRAKASVEQARTSYSNLVANIKIYDEMAELMKQAIDLKQRDVERKSALVKNSFGSQLDLDNSTNSAITVRAELAFVQQQRSSSLTQLLGNPNLKLEDFPPYYQAQAALAQAERDLDHTEMRAPMDGIATLVDQIQLGRFVVAGAPVFTIIDVAKPWIDSNLKESDMTHVAVGQPVEIEVDAFPDHVFKGTVGSLSPGTGAQFAILPPQNATGNFVKVVQRIPVRIYFDQNDPLIKKLKAGMSAYATVDTGHKRTLAGLLGIHSVHAKQDEN
jgi:membrane fusion protein, multidrug efflux system